MKLKKTISMLLALALLCALPACGGGTGDSQSTGAGSPNTSAPTNPGNPDTANTPAPEPKEPIKIGHLVDLQGAEATTGQEAVRALQFALDYYGGEIAGHPVTIVTGDAQGAANTAVDAARNLVEAEEVIALFGPTQAGEKSAVSEYVNEAEVPLIFYNGTPSYLFATNPWLIGVGGANPQMTMMADYVYNDLGYHNVNILTMDNIGFRTFSDDFAKAFEALGGTIAVSQYAPMPETYDWAPYLVNMDQDADAILAWSTGTNAIGLWTTWYQTGMHENLPMVALMQSAFLDYFVLRALENADPAMADAVLGTAAPSMYVYNTGTPENEAFVEAWQAEFGELPMTNLAGQCFQSFQLLATAIEALDAEGKALTNENLRDALLACEIDGPAGHMSFGENGACTKDVYIVEAVRLDDGSYNYEVVKTYEDVAPSGLLEN